MFERFTERARRAMASANKEAQRLNHEYIGSEHVLLGLLSEGSGVAAKVLLKMGVTLADVRREVARLVRSGVNAPPQRRLPQTPRAAKLIERAITESRALRHNYVGTEHLLLALVQELDGIPVQILRELGVEPEQARANLLAFLGSANPAAPHELDDEGLTLHMTKTLEGVLGRFGRATPPDSPTDTLDLLLAMFEIEHSAARQCLNQLGVTTQQLADASERLRSGFREP